ncbi:MIP18 family protein [Dirofilaria immitis]
MFLHWLPFFIILINDYIDAENIYQNNRCSQFLGQIFICKRVINDEPVTSLFIKDDSEKEVNDQERVVAALPNPWISLLTRKFRLKWLNQKEH